MFKLWISLLIIIFGCINSVIAKEPSFVSTSPSLTELMYALDAQDMLKAVSTQCSFPEDAKNKPVIGDTYFIDEEMLLKIRPDYFLATDSAEFMINKYKRFGIKPLAYKYPNIDAIYDIIYDLGRLTNREENAKIIVNDLKEKIEAARQSNKNPKKILYVVSMHPFMTIGGRSFLTDIIEKSGNHSITKDLDTFYPAISVEYAMNQKPDIIVLDYYCFSEGKMEKLFPNAKIITMTKADSDIIDRPANRIYKSVEFFARIANEY